MSDNNWLKNLKVGDMVFVTHCYGKRIDTIERITPTGKIVIDDIHYTNGVNKYYEMNLLPVTADDLRIEAELRFINDVSDKLRHVTLSYEQAQAINKLLNLGSKI